MQGRNRRQEAVVYGRGGISYEHTADQRTEYI